MINERVQIFQEGKTTANESVAVEKVQSIRAEDNKALSGNRVLSGNKALPDNNGLPMVAAMDKADSNLEQAKAGATPDKKIGGSITQMEVPASVSAADWMEYRYLTVGHLKVNPKYQRMLKRRWAQQIADRFNPDLVQVIHVSYREGEFWIIDGQHTTEAIRLKFNDPEYPVLCKIYYGLTEEEESEMFFLFNKCKQKMTASEMLKAQAFAGDKEITRFIQLTREAGFIIDPSRPRSCRNGISAVSTAQKCYMTLGADGYARMLHMLRAIWSGESWTLTQKMLSAMREFLVSYGDQVDDAKFIRRLLSVSEESLVRESRKFSARGVSLSLASAMVSLYNKGLRTGRLNIEKLVLDRM